MFCKNKSLDRCFPFNLLRFSVKMSPAFENNLSDETEVATIERYLKANFDKFGYVFSILFHQYSGLSVSGITSVLK